MKFKTALLVSSLMLLTSGCLQKGGEANSTSTSGSVDRAPANTPVAQNPQSESGCSVTNMTGGAQISCGQTNAFLSNGNNGAHAKVPVLIDGNPGGNPANQNKQIGDYLISVTKNSGAELITVWIEKEDAILQYENAIVYPRDRAVFYNSNDCSGDGMYQTNPNIHSPMLGMGDRIVYWDRYYRLESEVVHCYPRSKRESDGSCTQITGPMSGDFLGYVVKPADPGVSTVLSNGYKVKLK